MGTEGNKCYLMSIAFDGCSRLIVIIEITYFILIISNIKHVS